MTTKTTIPRTFLSVELPDDGDLNLSISNPTQSSNNHVFVAKVKANSPCAGKIMDGDWIEGINGVSMTNQTIQVVANALSKKKQKINGQPKRVMEISRVVVLGKENASNAETLLLPAAAVQKNHPEHPVLAASSISKPTSALPDMASLLTTTVPKLRDECRKQGLKHTGNKDVLLTRLGLPATQWKAWRRLKVPELKEVLRAKGLKVSGNKEELLTRLGVPVGFGETPSEKTAREIKELLAKRKQQTSELYASALTKKLKKDPLSLSTQEPSEDPNHEEYSEPCCAEPTFPGYRDYVEPAGCISFRDGSMMEVWRCLTCGQIPHYPNASPVEVYSDREEVPMMGPPGEDCVIQ